MTVLDRPGDTYNVIVNGYLLTLKNHDDKCSGMHGADSCSCGADSYNKSARAGAENRPAKNPPDKIPLTHFQLIENVKQAREKLKNIIIPHDPHCPIISRKKKQCRCAATAKNAKIQAVRDLLSLE